MSLALVIQPDGVANLRGLSTLDDYQKAVGGYIEGLNLCEDAYSYINEEGKLNGLPLNELATYICRLLKVGLSPDDYITGPMVIAGQVDENGNHHADVPQRFQILIGLVDRLKSARPTPISEFRISRSM